MSGNKENLKVGRGRYVSSQLKCVVIDLHNKLVINNPNSKKGDIIDEIKSITKLSKTTIYDILKKGCVSPKKRS
jgi:hypothetical protein